MSNNTNNPPDVILELDLATAQLLLEDADAACQQMLTILIQAQDSDVSENFIRKMTGLLDAKMALKRQLEKALAF